MELGLGGERLDCPDESVDAYGCSAALNLHLSDRLDNETAVQIRDCRRTGADCHLGIGRYLFADLFQSLGNIYIVADDRVVDPVLLSDVASPEWMPMRMRIGSSARSALALLSAAMPARMASAAQQARIARFFCFSGEPKKAMTLSPMNLSTVLPSASMPPEAHGRHWRDYYKVKSSAFAPMNAIVSFSSGSGL